LVLGYVGGKPADGVIHFAGMDLPLLRIGQACALYYFGYFVAILPFLSSREKARELPKSIFEHTEKKYKNIK
jgi:quinol-cytochrome oxidoreductase complex cytochrome b subunit